MISKNKVCLKSLIVVKVYIWCISKKVFMAWRKKWIPKVYILVFFEKVFFWILDLWKPIVFFYPPNILRTCPEEVKEMGVSIYGKVPELVQGGSLKNCCVRTHGFKPHLYYRLCWRSWSLDILRTVTCSWANAEVMGSNPIQSKSFFS